MTVHSVDEYGHSDKIIGMKYKDRKLSKKNLIVSLFIKINPDEEGLGPVKLPMRYLGI